jgi:hypothetical protein
MMNRRELLARLAALGMVGIPTTATGQTRPLNILWRNAWAIVNIGDIGHVPGALALLRHYIPEAAVTLWAQQDLVFRDAIARRARFPEGSVDAATVSRKVIPDLKVVYGRLDEPEDSFKGDMFIDIGLGDWYVPDINRATGDDIARMLMGIVSDIPAARAKLAKAMAFVNERHRFGMMEVRRALGLPTDGTAGFPDRVYR